ncbi:MAG: hypothetical protein PUP92_39635 [Rhizonema sp. PD38]|nr:hypothetical protein [Rhizonema sp. PD38]
MTKQTHSLRCGVFSLCGYHIRARATHQPSAIATVSKPKSFSQGRSPPQASLFGEKLFDLLKLSST